jgi:hypothetical protein
LMWISPWRTLLIVPSQSEKSEEASSQSERGDSDAQGHQLTTLHSFRTPIAPGYTPWEAEHPLQIG